MGRAIAADNVHYRRAPAGGSPQGAAGGAGYPPASDRAASDGGRRSCAAVAVGRYASRGTTWGHGLYNGCAMIYITFSINQACRLIPPPYICTRGCARTRAIAATVRLLRCGSGPPWEAVRRGCTATAIPVSPTGPRSPSGATGGSGRHAGGRLRGRGCALIDGGRTGYLVRPRQRGSGPPERSHPAQAAALELHDAVYRPLPLPINLSKSVIVNM